MRGRDLGVHMHPLYPLDTPICFNTVYNVMSVTDMQALYVRMR